VSLAVVAPVEREAREAMAAARARKEEEEEEGAFFLLGLDAGTVVGAVAVDVALVVAVVVASSALSVTTSGEGKAWWGKARLARGEGITENGEMNVAVAVGKQHRLEGSRTLRSLLPRSRSIVTGR